MVLFYLGYLASNLESLADTLSIGRAIHGVEVSGSLKALAERYGVGQKGTEVLDAKGKGERTSQKKNSVAMAITASMTLSLRTNYLAVCSKASPSRN